MAVEAPETPADWLETPRPPGEGVYGRQVGAATRVRAAAQGLSGTLFSGQTLSARGPRADNSTSAVTFAPSTKSDSNA